MRHNVNIIVTEDSHVWVVPALYDVANLFHDNVVEVYEVWQEREKYREAVWGNDNDELDGYSVGELVNEFAILNNKDIIMCIEWADYIRLINVPTFKMNYFTHIQ